MKPYDVPNERSADYPINEMFLNRWSPRSMSGGEISKEELMGFFEAGRWAPSSSNIQPWRFLYALKGKPEWDVYFDLLIDFNKMWCKNASALVVVVSKKKHEGKENKTHSFDTGAAWMSLALQARINNLVAHGMAGFDYEKAKKVLGVPEEYNIEAMIAIGRQGRIEDLDEGMQKSEKPNERKKVEEFVFEGKFKL